MAYEERHYKAFISYRHLPDDMRIAKKVDRTIERYVIPSSLRVDGQKILGYAFRDQEELPVSSDLSNSIRNALDRSEYLIVICSPDTPKSRWVLEEIEYFLSTHDRDHVLAVLISGTPEESFPRPLLEAKQPDGTVKAVEPLAANIVADSLSRQNQLFATEKLRILAALIGCPYDGLYKREQRYQVRRLASVLAAVLLVSGAFIGVLLGKNREILQKNQEIQANYQKALINQSNYLASESLKLLESGDQFGAIELALHALPSENEPDRPVLSKAVYALASAAHIYTSQDQAGQLNASGELYHNAIVDQFFLSRDGKYVCTHTTTDVVTVWEAGTMKMLWSKSLDDDLLSLYFINSGTIPAVLIHTDDRLECLNAVSGEMIWLITENVSQSFSIVFVPEENDSVVLAHHWLDVTTICILDPESGKPLREFSLRFPDIEYVDLDTSFREESSCISADGRYLFLSYNEGSSFPGFIAVVDLTAEITRCSFLFSGEMYIRGLKYFPEIDEFCVILIPSNVYFHSGSSGSCFQYGINAKTGEIFWTRELDYSSNTPFTEFGWNDSGEPVLAFAYSTSLDLLDPFSGTVLSHSDFAERIVSLDSLPRSKKGSTIIAVSDSGQYLFCVLEDNPLWLGLKYFVDEVDAASCRWGCCWILPHNSQFLIRYLSVSADPSWDTYAIDWTSSNSMSVLPDDFWSPNAYTGDGYVPVLGQRKDGITSVLARYDEDKSHLKELLLPSRINGVSAQYLYHSHADSILTFIWYGKDACGTYTVDSVTGESSVKAADSPDYSFSGFLRSSNGTCYAVKTMKQNEAGVSEYYVCSLTEDLQPKSQFLLGSIGSDAYPTLIVNTNGQLIASVSDSEAFLLDKDLTGAVPIPSAAAAPEQILWSAKMQRFCLQSDNDKVDLCDTDGNSLITIRSVSNRIEAMALDPEEAALLTVENDRYFRRYDLTDGALLNQVYLDNYVPGKNSILFRFTDSDFLCLSTPSILYTIDTYDWDMTSYVPYALGYDDENDLFPSTYYSDHVKTLGFFPRYSIESLISYGRSILNGWEMDGTQKKAYGID